MREEAIRYAYAGRLCELGDTFPEMVVLDADVSSSTRSVEFGAKYPDRFYNMGIAEANMVCAAAGMATMGLLPVVNSFSFLLCERALDQLRSSVAYTRLPVKFAASYGGMSDSFDGPSHHTLSDLAIIRAMPNMKLVVFSDGDCARALLEPILRDPAPVYFRLCRAPTVNFHAPGTKFELGKMAVLREGSDVTLVSTGIPTAFAVEAADKLAEKGISAEVLEAHTLKPFDAESLLASVKKTGRVVTVEEANVIGGLGGAVAEALCAGGVAAKMRTVGVQDRFMCSGPYMDILARAGISPDHIVEKTLEFM